MRTSKYVAAVVSAAVCLIAGAAAAQNYPNKPIRFVVPFPPGNTIDTVARIFADNMSPVLGQPIIIDNQAGANGLIGYSVVARAAPDGYVIGFGGSGMSSAPYLVKEVPFDNRKDFTPIALTSEVPLTLVVSTKSTINSVADLIAQAKQNPGRMTYAAPNTISQFASERLKALAGIDMTVVPYRASQQALVDVGNNEVSIFFVGLATAQPSIDAKTVRAIGWTAETRPAAMPSLPTLGETLPGFYTAAWIGILGPAKMPAPLVERLNGEFLKALRNGVAAKLTSISIEPRPSSPQELSAYIERDIQGWAEVAKAAKWEPQ